MHAGPRNLITDIDGLTVGNAEDAGVRTGVSVLMCERPMTASVAILGGAPGTRDTALLEPEQTVGAVDALVLSGGSAFGLDAPGGVMAHLASLGRGFSLGSAAVPIVPGAILFDLQNGGDKAWGSEPPYPHLGRTAAAQAAPNFSIGRAGAGLGATCGDGAGGLGSASAILDDGTVVGALVAVNAVGSVTIPGTDRFWAAPFELDGEFGGRGMPSAPDTALRVKPGARPGLNTTIGIVATNAALNKAGCKRLAIMAHDGIARAIWPAHTPLDGDLVFAVASGERPAPEGHGAMVALGAAASATMARAIARAVYEARR